MSSTQVNIYEAKTHFSKLVDRASKGEEIVIAKAGKPVARLVPPIEKQEAQPPRVFGRNLLGITFMAEDWDEDLPPEWFESSDNDHLLFPQKEEKPL